jgi:hypothetical protein
VVGSLVLWAIGVPGGADVTSPDDDLVAFIDPLAGPVH